MDKPINYFVVTVQIIKNSLIVLTEEHGIKGYQETPEHGFNRLRDSIKSKRYLNHPKDKHEIHIVHYDKVTEPIYVAKFGK